MSLVIDAPPVPLAPDQDGVVRVSGTRVTLDSIVLSYRQGATAEEIADRFPGVALPDVYAVIGYYLRRRTEVDAYLDERQHARESVRLENEARFPPEGIRDRLSARRSPDR